MSNKTDYLGCDMDRTFPKRVKVMAGIAVLLSAVCICLTAHITIFQKKYCHAVNSFYDAVEQADFVLPASGIIYAVLALALIIIGSGTFLGGSGRNTAKTAVIMWIVFFIGADIAFTVQMNHLLDNIHEGSVTWVLQPINRLISGAAEILLSVSAVLAAAAADMADTMKNGRRVGSAALRLAIGAYAAYIISVWAVMLFSRGTPVILLGVIGFTVCGAIICTAMVSAQKGKGGMAGLIVSLSVFSASLIFSCASNNYQSFYMASTGADTYTDFAVVSGLCGKLMILYYIGTAAAAIAASRAAKD